MQTVRLFAFLVVVTGFPCLVAGEVLHGRVVGVLDGDTITVLDPYRRQHRVRLHQVDAPEKEQDFGRRARRSLAELVYGKEVSVQAVSIDRYHRLVGRVSVAGRDINLELIRRGMAWVYRQYGADPAYLAAEESARRARIGLWSRSDAIPPWEFRHDRKGPTQHPFSRSRTIRPWW